jgi:transposase-like protein
MDFPLTELLDEAACTTWLIKHLHQHGLQCPRCGRGVTDARHFRWLKRSGLELYRCKHCQDTYTLYTRTVFAGCHLRPTQVVLLWRGIVQGVSSAQLARELTLARATVLRLRHALQLNAEAEQVHPPA